MLNAELLEKARTTAAAVAEAERQALLARGEYHAAVRRLHLAGASLREIAQALSISHQRVQQIVNGAGGTWWSRVWRTRRATADAICTWCGRPARDVGRMIAGPHVYICDGCIESAERILAGRPSAGPFTAVRTRGAPCAFCRRRGSAARPLVAAPAGHVCAGCLTMCREIRVG